jgi:predicted ester cyclase
VSSQAEENKALVLRFLKARVKPDLGALDKMLAPNFVSRTKLLPGQPPDREGYKWSVAEFSAAFSDIRFIIEEQVAEGDKVVTRYTVHATHDRKELLGVAPTGREMASMAIYIHRISEGKITEEWSLGTVGLKLMEQRRERIGSGVSPAAGAGLCVDVGDVALDVRVLTCSSPATLKLVQAGTIDDGGCPSVSGGTLP